MTVSSKTSAPGAVTCVLDQTVVNDKTIGDMADLGLSFFATLCGRNRGAFVLDTPGDAHTWGCTAFPDNIATLAGLDLSSSRDNKNTNRSNTTHHEKKASVIHIKDANAISQGFAAGNLTAAETVTVLDYFIKMVYHSSPNVDQDPYACEVGGLATLQCDPVNTLPTIRSVTLAGLLVPAPTITRGKPLTLKQATKFYEPEDFDDMVELGLNTVQIPVPLDVFSAALVGDVTAKKDSSHADEQKALLSQTSRAAAKAGLETILVLVGEDNDDAVTAAAHFAVEENLYALTLPSLQSLRAARAAGTSLKLFIPLDQGQLKYLTVPDENVFVALDFGHTTTVADIASSTSMDDRSKLFYHEATSCIARSPLEYTACFRRVPAMVAYGFDLAIDNCVLQNSTDSNDFVDYGQCGRFDETVDSAWWHRHRASFAARQLVSYEHGLGWSFAAWKLYGGSNDKDDLEVIDHPAQLLALKNVAAAGLFPSLHDKVPAQLACLNPPVNDFLLGDATLSPTPGPPPDCGNGWWNYDLKACEYWIPPAPTAQPTPLPTTHWPTAAPVVCPDPPFTYGSLVMAGGAGALVAVLVGFVWNKFCGSRRREGYSEVPSTTV